MYRPVPPCSRAQAHRLEHDTKYPPAGSARRSGSVTPNRVICMLLRLQRDARQRPILGNSGRCALAFICADLHAAHDGYGRQRGLVACIRERRTTTIGRGSGGSGVQQRADHLLRNWLKLPLPCGGGGALHLQLDGLRRPEDGEHGGYRYLDPEHGDHTCHC